MENLQPKEGQEKEPTPKDISSEFLKMAVWEFLAFLRTQRKEPSLSIIIDWQEEQAARRLKGFLEDSEAIQKGQKRRAAIRATEEQYRKALNVFASGVKWIKVENKE